MYEIAIESNLWKKAFATNDNREADNKELYASKNPFFITKNLHAHWLITSKINKSFHIENMRQKENEIFWVENFG